MNNETITNLGEVKPVIVIGGKTGKFVPNMNMSFHDDEFFINLNRENKIITDEIAEIQEYKTVLSGNDNDIFHVNENGEFKWDIELKEKPESNIFKWKLKSKGVEFFYQGELTPEEIEKGCERPEEAIGSYAVYCDKANNKYKTGKVCHIYRPLCIDKNGRKVYAELLIDDKYLTITIPQDYVDICVYPMTIDPTFGYTSVGESWFACSDRIIFYKATSGVSGIANPGSIYVYSLNGGTQYARCGLYESESGGINGASKLSSSEAELNISIGDVKAWFSGAVTVSGGISSSTDYILAVHGDSFYIAYDDGGSAWYDGLTYTQGVNSLPSTGPNASSLSRYVSIYLNYTESTPDAGGILVGDSALVGGSLLCGQGVLIG